MHADFEFPIFNQKKKLCLRFHLVLPSEIILDFLMEKSLKARTFEKSRIILGVLRVPTFLKILGMIKFGS